MSKQNDSIHNYIDNIKQFFQLTFIKKTIGKISAGNCENWKLMDYFIFFVTFTLTSDLNTLFFKSNDAKQIYCINTFVTCRESYVASVKQVYCVPVDHQSFENLVKCELNCWFSLNLPHSVRMNTKNCVLSNNEIVWNYTFSYHYCELKVIWHIWRWGIDQKTKITKQVQS